MTSRSEIRGAAPRIGDWVLAVGNPFGLGGTVTAGIVSARGRDIGAGPYDDFIQIDAPVNKGNSGGPTFDVEGNVIGMNTAIVSPSGGSVGIGFAIPAETVKSVIAQLKEKGAVTRGWIGVQIQAVTSDIAENLGLKEARGALVAEPQANGPAIKAGIEAGDVITAVNGTAVKDSREFARTISGMAPGTSVKLTVIAQGRGEERQYHARRIAEEREAAPTSRHLGPERHQCAAARPVAAPAAKVAGSGVGVVVPRWIRTDCRRARLQDRRRDHGGRPARRSPIRPTCATRLARRRRTASDVPDAGEVGRCDEVRRRSPRPA